MTIRPWCHVNDRSPGVEFGAIGLYHFWFDSQGGWPPIDWEDLVPEDQERFRRAAVGGVCAVVEALWDRDADEDGPP